jgi:DNA-binding NarL/FixJ family response regulator
MIKVFITDDQEIIQNGLQRILADADDITIAGIYSNGDQLLQAVQINQPDVLLLDIQMPGKSGIELAGIIGKDYPQVKIIALTNIDVLTQVRKMLQQGCAGYLLKDASPTVIIQAIHAVYAGERFLHQDIQQQLIDGLFEQKPKHVITRREKEILQLITEEFTNQEIADKLFLSLRTVENHRNNLLQKLGVKNTAGLVKAALQEGLI